MNVTHQRVEYLTRPLGLDEPWPRFSYLITGEEKDLKQRAYRVLVATSEDKLQPGLADLWDSGRVVSPCISQIQYAGKPLAFGQKCWYTCISYSERDVSAATLADYFTVGFLDQSDIRASFIYYEQPMGEEDLAHPVRFAKSVEISRPVASAYAYVSALGVMEFSVDGTPASDCLLAPEWTAYTKRVQYQTYDITSLLKEGTHELGATLSNGWYCGLWQKWPPRPHFYGGKYPEFFCQLEITYSDGSTETIITDESWRATTSLPEQFAGIYEGETYDARIPVPKLEDDVWIQVKTSDKAKTLTMSSQKSEPIRVTERLHPVSVTSPRPGVYVVDFGQNFAGRVACTFHEPAGTAITLLHNEMLNPDGTVYMDNLVTCLFTPGVDRQVLRYICRGENDTYAPRFTYMGFRYVEIHGLSAPPQMSDFVGEVFHTDFAKVGHFICSDSRINRLQQNICWSHRSNTMGIPTDCPSRDERCGYTGDLQFFLPTGLMNMDMAAFLNKWLVDMCADAQFEDGCYMDHAPDFGMNGGVVGWGDAGIICPYLAYQTYGDIRNIQKHFNSMQRYVEYLRRDANPDGTRGPDHVGLGDWLSMGGGASLEVVGSAYYAYILRIFSEMAAAIGKTEEATYYGGLAKTSRVAFGERFISEDGRIKDSSLTGFALALTMGLVPNEKWGAVAAAFATEVEAQNCRLTTGFMGTPRLLIALGMINRHDLAHRLLWQTECPSWLYPVTVGATTIWERWNGWTEEKGFEWPGMNSFNHFAFGSVGHYFYRYILGISQPAGEVGYRDFVIEPYLPDCLDHAEGCFRGMNGEVKVAWRREGAYVCLDVTVPPNTTAEIFSPVKTGFSDSGGIRRSQLCGSGVYSFYCSGM